MKLTTSSILRSMAAFAVAALVLTATAPVAQARKGADDPATHNVGDDKGGLRADKAAKKAAKAAAKAAKKGKKEKVG